MIEQLVIPTKLRKEILYARHEEYGQDIMAYRRHMNGYVLRQYVQRHQRTRGHHA